MRVAHCCRMRLLSYKNAMSSDMTKCVDAKCPSKDTCLRWLTPWRPPGQGYADFNRQEDAQKCEHYEPVEAK